MQRFLLALCSVVLGLIVANATCDTSGRQEELLSSYRLVQFRLAECQDMGAGQLDPGGLEKAITLSARLEEKLAGEHRSGADHELSRLEKAVSHMCEQMKSWDPDGDGISNYAEFMLYGTAWNRRDSDGDGYVDGSEILRYQTDPLDHCGVPLGVPLEVPVHRRCSAIEDFRRGS